MGQSKTIMMKKNILIGLGLFFISSCIVVPKRVIKNFKGCFNPKKTGLDSLINIKGFYYLGEDYDYISTGEYIFYDNGFTERSSGEYWINQDFEDSKYSSYGKYTIANDTIKIQIISNPVSMGISEYRVWFKIIDYNSIELIYRGNSIHNITKSKYESI